MSGIERAQSGHFERCDSIQCSARGCQASGPNPPCGGYPARSDVLPNPDRHPSWCKCQRVCGGDQ